MKTLEPSPSRQRAFNATPAGQIFARIEANLEDLYGRRMGLRTKGRIERCWMRLMRKQGA
jgi:hypothetical protein